MPYYNHNLLTQICPHNLPRYLHISDLFSCTFNPKQILDQASIYFSRLIYASLPSSLSFTMDKIVPGSLLKLCKEGSLPSELYLQAHQSKSIRDDNCERLRLMLNDGENMINGVFKPNDEQSTIDNFKRFSVLKITRYEITPTQAGKTFLVLDRAEVVAQGDKPSKPFTNVDDYFKEHPNENYFINKNGSGSAPTSVSPPPVKEPKTASQPRANHDNILSIDQLSPYQSSWTIRARVSYKGDMRTWHNERGDGKLFNVNFLDETGEIRATGFNAAADKFYDLLQEKKAYYVSKCTMQQAKPQFSHLEHPYELQFDKDTIIEPCEDDSALPKNHFSFYKLDQVQNLDNGIYIDVIGVLKEVRPKTEIIARSTGKPFDRRDVVIVDDTHFAITVALWNKSARDFDLEEGTVVAFKGARVQDYNGKSLSLASSSTIFASPDIPEAYKLKGWYDSQGKQDTFQSIHTESSGRKPLDSKEAIAERITISQAQDQKLGFNEKPDYFNIKATVSFVKPDSFSYPACQTENCNRKVIEQADGSWRCEKCNKSFQEPDYRYVLTLSIVDQSGQLWVTLFNETAQKFMKCTAKELLALKEDSEMDGNSLKKYINANVAFKEYAFSVKAKLDNYNGIDRARYQVLGIAEISPSVEADALVDAFDKLNL